MQTTTWASDPTHSEISFKVKHLMITNVKGEFRTFNATIEGDDFSKARVEAIIDAASIFTNNDDRDGHLKSADFFDVENHPQIKFISTAFNRKTEDEYILEGELTIRAVTKPVSFTVEYGGTNKDPWGNEKAGFSLSGKINRKDWGLNWNAALETGGVLVSDEVKVNAEIQFVKK